MSRASYRQLTFADGYADAMQGNDPQTTSQEYIRGYDSVDAEVTSGFADLEPLLEGPPTCPMCGDQTPNLLGKLGTLTHYRCRECGATYHS